MASSSLSAARKSQSLPESRSSLQDSATPNRLRHPVQVHLRLRKADADTLKNCAEERGQTLSAFVRFLLRRYLHEIDK
jgi:hypothetical protein